MWTQARPWAHIPTLKADALIHGNCLNDDFPSHLATKELLSFWSGNTPNIIWFTLIILVLEVKVWLYKKPDSNHRFLLFSSFFPVLFFSFLFHDTKDRNTTQCPHQSCTTQAVTFLIYSLHSIPLEFQKNPYFLSCQRHLHWPGAIISCWSTEPWSSISVTRPNRPWPDRLQSGHYLLLNLKFVLCIF